MKRNIELNKTSTILDNTSKRLECMVCDWLDPPHLQSFHFSSHTYPDVILVADCVWVESLVRPLLNTLDQYTGPNTLVIITYQQRGKDAHVAFMEGIESMFGALDQNNFAKLNNCISVDTKNTYGLDKPDSIILMECKRNQTSK